MKYNQEADTRNRGRTIGNGVVVAHATLSFGAFALAFFADLDPHIALAVFAAGFLVVFVGDHRIQHADMADEAEPDESDEADEADAGQGAAARVAQQ